MKSKILEPEAKHLRFPAFSNPNEPGIGNIKIENLVTTQVVRFKVHRSRLKEF
jgi:hypothetical protein